MKVRLQREWRSKPHPWWFVRRYPSGGWTVQCMWLNVWGKSRAAAPVLVAGGTVEHG